jgi:putative spermidine/putrescine transport system permease protein
MRKLRMAPSAYVWLVLAALYFLVPLVATALFSLKSNATGKCCTLDSYDWVIHQHAFWHTLRTSFLLAVETIVVCLVLFVPTIYLVHLKLPKLRPLIAFLALIPFVVPPIVMVVGASSWRPTSSSRSLICTSRSTPASVRSTCTR